jgi:hypothetical protein
MQEVPTHQADDMGARLAAPFGLVVEIKTTGVPK